MLYRVWGSYVVLLSLCALELCTNSWVFPVGVARVAAEYNGADDRTEEISGRASFVGKILNTIGTGLGDSVKYVRRLVGRAASSQAYEETKHKILDALRMNKNVTLDEFEKMVQSFTDSVDTVGEGFSQYNKFLNDIDSRKLSDEEKVAELGVLIKMKNMKAFISKYMYKPSSEYWKTADEKLKFLAGKLEIARNNYKGKIDSQKDLENLTELLNAYFDEYNKSYKSVITQIALSFSKPNVQNMKGHADKMLWFTNSVLPQLKRVFKVFMVNLLLVRMSNAQLILKTLFQHFQDLQAVDGALHLSFVKAFA